MKRTILSLFAALAFAATARSQNPDKPRPDGPSLDRLKHEVEELRRAGKNEEAERLQQKAREAMERRKDSEARERKEPEARDRKPEGAQEPRREKPKGEPKPEPKGEQKSAAPQARKEGKFGEGQMADRLKGRIEQLRRDGKGEQAENFAKNARAMWEKRRGGQAGADHGKPSGDKPPQKSGDRAMHLAEAAKHLTAAGIHVSPEMLEKFGQKTSGKPEQHPWFSHRSQSAAGSPGGFGGRTHFPSKDGAAPGAGSRFDAMRKNFGGASGRPPFPPAPGAGLPGQHPFPPKTGPAPEGPQGSRADAMHRGPGGMPERVSPPQPIRAPGAGASDSVQNEIRALAKQVQELRAMIQQQPRAGAPAPMPQAGGGGFQRPQFHAPQAGPADPGANREHRDAPQRASGDNHPRGEGRPPNPPGNPAIPGGRPHGGAPQP